MSEDRKVERVVEINAPAEEVWRALTEGEELKRWFPLDAKVNPGAGGSVWLSWGEGSEWESPIEIWEPSRHLRTVDTIPGTGDTPPRRIAVDYYIESRGGTTTLRLVHSGFAADTWEDELDTMGAGWATFLDNLRHYLERHRGQPRRLAYVRHAPVPKPRDEVFQRTMNALGIDPAAIRIGGRYSGTSKNGLRLEGVTRLYAPPINFTATVENWSDASLMVEIEPGRERCRPAIWLSLYGEAGKDGDDVEKLLRKLLEVEFAEG